MTQRLRRRSRRRRRTQTNTIWGPLLQLAFKLLGHSTVARAGIDGTSHALEILSVTASIAEELLYRAVGNCFGQPKAYKSLVVMRGHDATPIEVEFGQLTGKLQDFAKYFVKEDGKWVTKTYQEMQEMHVSKRGSLKYGRTELLGATCTVCWSEHDSKVGASVRRRRDIPIKPMILQRGNASCLQIAWENAIPALATENINFIAAFHRWVLVQNTPDNVAAALLQKKYLEVSSLKTFCVRVTSAARRIGCLGLQRLASRRTIPSAIFTRLSSCVKAIRMQFDWRER